MSLTMLRTICRQQNLRQAPALVCSRFCHGQVPKGDGDGGGGDKQQPNAKEKLAVKYSRENVKRNVQGYVFSRFFDYVKNYDKVLEKQFPSAMHVYRVFLVGVKEFFNDMKKLVKITKIVYSHDNDLRCLTRKEIELYYQMPRDMKKVAPVLLVSALPFANYVVFPLAYMYPRTFLTSHFWSIQQKGDFAQQELKQRLQYNRRVFRCMQAKLDSMRKTKDPQFDKCSYILGLLGSGLHPTSAEILDVKDLFTRAPFGLRHLSSVHLKYLCRLHDLRPGLMRRYRLSERAYVVHHMDLAIKREGGVHNMPIESLKHACFLRGLNATNLSAESMIAWLNEWVEVSLIINQDNISLFLHLPILLSYNHPNNWILKG
ncbi:ANON-66Db protein [Culex quinquefasciatus]|uniref:ANON-66Db protein n=1 Tax=Culex quinquefasciatus TaxID=7176 RepID=B0VZ66_CULQU|nr:LETM1 domain-containing protein 1 [Culex quinquefasciatus]EDS25642.1 ANON-66Db protein [Culex quinquefasciatus]|eukprot:XP_001841689.1 ANON-66Db protein [Culex quinquefasciatus]